MDVLHIEIQAFVVVESWLGWCQESGIKEQDSQVCVCVRLVLYQLLSMLEARGSLLPTLDGNV